MWIDTIYSEWTLPKEAVQHYAAASSSDGKLNWGQPQQATIIVRDEDVDLRIDNCDAQPLCTAPMKLVYLFCSLSYQSLPSIIK